MLRQLIDQITGAQSVKDKLNIARTHQAIGGTVDFTDPFGGGGTGGGGAIPITVGDDCAAIPDGNGAYLLFAAEGIITPFLEDAPWFAGYSAVMVNISDVCSMGGLPLAVTDVVWLKDETDGKEVWAGMLAASEAYGVPIVGGHTCYRSEKRHLAVSVIGKARKLLTSYDAEAGDELLMAVDLNGAYFGGYPFWDASTGADATHLRKTMRLPYEIAEAGLSGVAKDISMGGVIGTLAMLLHSSAKGACLQLENIPRPAGTPWEKWLISFPSFGYLLTAKSEKAGKIKELFANASIACETIGVITARPGISIHCGEEKVEIKVDL
jgi:AIR synthase-related protein